MKGKTRKAVALAAATLALGVAGAYAATGNPFIGVPKGSIDGAKHAVASNGALKKDAVGNRQIKGGAVNCLKLSLDLQAAICTGKPGAPGTPGAPGANGKDGANGTNGVNGKDGANGAKGDKGDAGAPGDVGATGPKGAPGSPGAPGSTGATGAQGNPGPTGAAGPTGQAGPPGAPGTPGANGAPGPAGAAGQTPLMFGPYNSGSTDSSVCGNDWANDAYTRTYIVTPQHDGTYEVTELFKGVFTTIEGNSPNDSDCTSPGGDVTAGIQGTMYGSYALAVPAPADFDFAATCPAGCTTSDFFATFFNSAIPNTYAWEFYYNAPGHGSWANTDHGNSGNIH